MDAAVSTHQVVIMDDHATFAAGVSALVNSDLDFDVQGIFQTVADLNAHFEVTVPDVLIMDLQLGDESVTSEIRELTYRHPELPILVITLLDSRTYVHDAIAFGALGFLSKTSTHDQLNEALRAVMKGNHYFGAELGASVVNIDDEAIPGNLLSDRELDVLKRLALGFSPKEIGFELGLSDKTIHAHKNTIRQKLGLRRQSDIIRAAFSAGLVNVRDLVG
ncbi:MAG: response regulator transcription factor [Luminiphilus sp.]|nr:response regulator transcription factor [Luminiphilus sp.]